MKPHIIIICIILISGNCFAQSNNSSDSTSQNNAEKSTLTAGGIFSNNVSYYGQKAAGNTPYAAIAATWQLKSGFYFTGQAVKILNDSTSTISASALGAGFNFSLGKFTTDISFSHTFYPSYSPLLQAGNADNTSLSFSYDGWIKPTLTGDYTFGKSNDAFVTGEISKSINLFSFGKKDIVTLSPQASVVAGTQHFYQTYLTQKKLRDQVLGIVTDPLFGNPSANSSDTTLNTSFNLLTYNFNLSLGYNRAHYLVEAAYQLSVLDKHAQATGTGKVNSFLTLSFYYQF